MKIANPVNVFPYLQCTNLLYVIEKQNGNYNRG